MISFGTVVARRPRPAALLLAAALVGLVLAGAVGCGAQPAGTTPSAPSSSSSSSSSSEASSSSGGTSEQCSYQANGQAARPVRLPPTTGVAETGTATFVLTTNEGPVTITMDRSRTPCTINSFASLVAQKFYDDTSCHRLVDSGIFVLQCGDPTGTGSGGPGYSYADELDGSETYQAGTVAMANAGPDTNGSQFFLVYADSPLPPSYTVFGRMDKAGLDVVNTIQAEGEDGRYASGGGGGKPNNPAKIISVRLK